MFWMILAKSLHSRGYGGPDLRNQPSGSLEPPSRAKDQCSLAYSQLA